MLMGRYIFPEGEVAACQVREERLALRETLLCMYMQIHLVSVIICKQIKQGLIPLCACGQVHASLWFVPNAERCYVFCYYVLRLSGVAVKGKEGVAKIQVMTHLGQKGRGSKTQHALTQTNSVKWNKVSLRRRQKVTVVWGTEMSAQVNKLLLWIEKASRPQCHYLHLLLHHWGKVSVLFAFLCAPHQCQRHFLRALPDPVAQVDETSHLGATLSESQSFHSSLRTADNYGKKHWFHPWQF